MKSPFFDKSKFKQKKEKFKSKTDLFQEGRDLGIIKDLDDNMIHSIITGMAKQFVVLIKDGQLKMNKKTLELTYTVVFDSLKN